MRVALAFLSVSFAGSLAAQEHPPTPAWSFTVGAGVFAAPDYLGSDETRILPIPILGVEYKGRVFLGPAPGGLGAGLGVNLIRSQRFTLTAGLGGTDSRPEDRADALAGTDDRRLGLSAVSGIGYRIGPLEAGISVAAGLRDNAGVSGTGRLGLTMPLSQRIYFGLGGNVTVADGDNMRYDFGVSTTEAARRAQLIASGDPRLRPGDGRSYRPDGGVKEVGGSANLAVVLSPRWSAFGFAGVSRLSDEAAASPLVRRRTGWSGGGGITYRP